MDRVYIKDLSARGIIGIRPWEREKPQEILINVTAITDTALAGRTDDIQHCVDYSSLAKQLRTHAESAGRFTVEALAEDLAHICLAHQHVQKVLVRVEKPGAVRFAHSVGVEIERARDDRT